MPTDILLPAGKAFVLPAGKAFGLN